MSHGGRANLVPPAREITEVRPEGAEAASTPDSTRCICSSLASRLGDCRDRERVRSSGCRPDQLLTEEIGRARPLNSPRFGVEASRERSFPTHLDLTRLWIRSAAISASTARRASCCGTFEALNSTSARCSRALRGPAMRVGPRARNLDAGLQVSRAAAVKKPSRSAVSGGEKGSRHPRGVLALQVNPAPSAAGRVDAPLDIPHRALLRLVRQMSAQRISSHTHNISHVSSQLVGVTSLAGSRGGEVDIEARSIWREAAA